MLLSCYSAHLITHIITKIVRNRFRTRAYRTDFKHEKIFRMKAFSSLQVSFALTFFFSTFFLLFNSFKLKTFIVILVSSNVKLINTTVETWHFYDWSKKNYLKYSAAISLKKERFKFNIKNTKERKVLYCVQYIVCLPSSLEWSIKSIQSFKNYKKNKRIYIKKNIAELKKLYYTVLSNLTYLGTYCLKNISP